MVRRTGALLATAALLLGLPYLATARLHWPALDLSATSLAAHLRGGTLPPGIGTALLICALWAVWGLYVAALAAEAAALLHGRPPRRRLLGPLQIVAATALGATLTHPAVHAATAPSPPAAEPVSPQTPPSPLPVAPTAEPRPPADPTTGGGPVARERVIDGFGFDSAELTPEMKADLDRVGAMLRAHGDPDHPVVVTGHTDAAGAPDYNEDLSLRRAEAVANHLRTHLGEGAPPIEPQGAGATELLPGQSDDAQRRVDISYTLTPRPPAAPSPSIDTPAEPPEDESSPDTTAPSQAVIVLELPTGVLLTAAAAGGVGGGFALGRRSRRPNADGAAHDPPDPAAAGGTGTQPPPVDVHNVARLRDGIGLVGPGAPGAARSLIAAALRASAQPALRVVIPAADADRLLGTDTVELLAQRHAPALTIAPTLPDAVTELHTRILAGAEESHDGSPAAEPAPTTVLLAELDGSTADEVHALLRTNPDGAASAVALGHWPAGTCTLGPDHTVTAAAPYLAHLAGARWAPTTPEVLHRLISALPPRTGAAGGATPGPDRSGKPQVRLHVLGHVLLTADGEPAVLRRRSAAEVAAYLTLHRDGVTLDRAIEDLWPQESPQRATRRFHDATSALRTALRPHTADDGSTAVLHHNGRYRLNPHALSVDLWTLEDTLGAAEAEPGDSATQQRLLRTLTGFADFAAEEDYLWAEHHRVRIRDRVRRAALSAAEHAAFDTASALLDRAIAVDPTNDEAHCALIRRHLDNGDRDAATTAYRAYESALADIGASPDPEIRALLSSAPQN
ncbi:OmpA family protein [Streptomonospora sp. S1-112]|uniref:OmpA family protein n=1 Tax=Streptomonospora mangrovi TaxID=2883123 RepID=A0A9X3NN94_9ACTN|nr:OmpA family protein [Streptomonospora mangrovi]MDA0565171.1 OmpA family protein [Streptomonospora mangrovi]